MEQMPDRATIVAMRGRVDFYLWMGIPVARAWPRKSTQPRTAGEIASSEKFTTYVKMTGMLAPSVIQAYRDYVGGTGVTWVDMFRAAAGGRPWFNIGQ